MKTKENWKSTKCSEISYSHICKLLSKIYSVLDFLPLIVKQSLIHTYVLNTSLHDAESPSLHELQMYGTHSLFCRTHDSAVLSVVFLVYKLYMCGKRYCSLPEFESVANQKLNFICCTNTKQWTVKFLLHDVKAKEKAKQRTELNDKNKETRNKIIVAFDLPDLYRQQKIFLYKDTFKIDAICGFSLAPKNVTTIKCEACSAEFTFFISIFYWLFPNFFACCLSRSGDKMLLACCLVLC